MKDELKSIFFTSDWHLGHEKIIEFSNRPFKDLPHMHRSLIKNFNNTVPHHSVTYFLGDIGFGSVLSINKVITKLNGTKVLILGNHDRRPQAMYKAGFDVVLYSATLRIANQPVTLSHCPLFGLYRENTEGMKGAAEDENWHGESKTRNEKFTVPNKGQFHLHGHIHSPNNGRSMKALGTQYDVGVDANGYRPVSARRIEDWIVSTLYSGSW